MIEILLLEIVYIQLMILLLKKLGIQTIDMIKKYLLCCLTLIVATYSYSQNTSEITITREQLVTANLIFTEHKKLKETVPLLQEQIANLELINKSWRNTDSIRRIQLLNYENIIKDKDRSIEGLNRSLKNKKTIIKGGIISSCVLIICLIVK